MAFNTVPTVASGDSWTSSQHNTYIKDNMTALWPYTTAGDLAYATSSSTLGRLANTAGGLLYGDTSAPAWLANSVGGVLYGGASAPAWLAKPSVLSFLKMSSAGTPSYTAATALPGGFHVTGGAFTNSLISTTATASTYTGVAFNFILGAPCTVFAWATGMGRKNSATYEGYFEIVIDGTANPDRPTQIKSTAETMFFTSYVKTAVPAGARNVSLYYRTENAGDELFLERAQIYAIAFVDP